MAKVRCGAMAKFVKGLNNTERNGKSAVAILDDMEIKEVRLSNAILALANGEDILTDALEMSNKAWDENSALSTEAGKRYKTVESQIQIAKNKLQDVGITLGEKLMPFVQNLIGEIEEFVNWFGNLNTETQETIIKIGGIVAVAGPLLIIIGKLSTGLGALMSFGGKILTGIGKITAGLIPVPRTNYTNGNCNGSICWGNDRRYWTISCCNCRYYSRVNCLGCK